MGDDDQPSETAHASDYTVHSNDAEANKKHGYPSNFIRTAKYTVWNFVFKNLYEQFRRFSNIYFLLNAIATLIPSAAPVSPFTSIAPLVFVLAVTAIKDAVEDYRRYKADKLANRYAAVQTPPPRRRPRRGATLFFPQKWADAHRALS